MIRTSFFGGMKSEDGNRSDKIQMSALGRRFQLGTIYDYRSDSIIPGTLLWDPDELEEFVGSRTFALDCDNTFNIHVADELNEKWTSIGLDDHLKASWMTRTMIGPFRSGASAYLEDPWQSKGGRVCLNIRTVIHQEKIDPVIVKNKLDVICQKSVLQEGKASHVVIAVTRGLDTYCLFSHTDVDLAKDDAEELLRSAAERFRNGLMDGRKTVEDLSDFEEVQVTVFSDWNGQPMPSATFADAYQSCFQWMEQLDNSPPSVPLVAWMCSLQTICGRQTKPTPYQSISPDAVAQSLAMWSRLSKIQVELQYLLRAHRSNVADVPDHLKHFDLLFNRFLKLFGQRMSETVQAIRKGEGNERMLAKIDVYVCESSFNPDRLDLWLDRQRFQLDYTNRLAQILPGIAVIPNADLNKLGLVRCTLMLQLAILNPKKDTLLEEMDRYISSNAKLSSNPSVLPAPTCSGRQSLVVAVNKFAKFIVDNASNCNFLVSLVEEGASEQQARLLLYRRGLADCARPEDFVLPVAPKDLRIESNRRGRIILVWNFDLNLDVNCHLTGFRIEFRPIDQPEWTAIDSVSPAGRIQLTQLVHQVKYLFRVAALTPPGRSPFTPVLGPELVLSVCDPPSEIAIVYVTDSILKLRWLEPAKLDKDLKVTRYDLEYWPASDPETSIVRCSTHERGIKLEKLRRDTTYNIRVAAVCGSAGSSLFSPTIEIATLEEAERVALVVREVSSLVQGSLTTGASAGIAVFAVPMRSEDSDKNAGTQRMMFGFPGLKFQRKTILVVGATGSGKTTLINGMINYILNVQWEDDFRFRLISEPEKTQAHSQTDLVTAYDLFHMKGSRVDYSLTIVDTPGFGDTRGLERDKKILEQIRQYFSRPEGIQQLEAVCFVVQASLPRLTPTQIYIFESILSIFGKDVRDNIRLMVTFADSQEPPVLAAIQEAKIPSPLDAKGKPLHHKFNNSSFFAAKGDTMMDNFNRLFFSMGSQNFANFFNDLHRMPTTSLSMTKEVLNERKRLEVVVEGLQQRIHTGLIRVEEFKQIRRALTEHREQMEQNENFEFEVEHEVAEQEDISGTGHFVSNCQKCQWTCHYPCKYMKDEDRKTCFAMDANGFCRICPGRCSFSDHANTKYKWERVAKKVKKSSEEIRRNFETAQSEAATGEQVLQQLSEQLVLFEQQLIEIVDTTYPLIDRLNQIALRPHPFSAPEYIDLIITAEKQEHRQGYLARIETLQKLRQMADITSKLIAKKSIFETGDLNITPPVADPTAQGGVDTQQQDV